MLPLHRFSDILLGTRSHLFNSMRSAVGTSKSWKEYKGEEYDPNQKVLPEIPPWKQEFNPEVNTPNKTTVTILNEEAESTLMVDGFSNIGFTLNNGFKVLGSMILLGKTIFQWKINSVEDLTPEAFSIFYLIDPKVDVLVFGCGDEEKRFDRKILQELVGRRRLGIEVLSTNRPKTSGGKANNTGETGYKKVKE